MDVPAFSAGSVAEDAFLEDLLGATSPSVGVDFLGGIFRQTSWFLVNPFQARLSLAIVRRWLWRPHHTLPLQAK